MWRNVFSNGMVPVSCCIHWKFVVEKYSLSYGTNEYGNLFIAIVRKKNTRVQCCNLTKKRKPMERRELNSNNRKCILSLLHMPSLLRLRLYLNNNEKGNNTFNNRKYIPSFRMSQLRLLWFVPHNSMKKGTIGRNKNKIVI